MVAYLVIDNVTATDAGEYSCSATYFLRARGTSETYYVNITTGICSQFDPEVYALTLIICLVLSAKGTQTPIPTVHSVEGMNVCVFVDRFL